MFIYLSIQYWRLCYGAFTNVNGRINILLLPHNIIIQQAYDDLINLTHNYVFNKLFVKSRLRWDSIHPIRVMKLMKQAFYPQATRAVLHSSWKCHFHSDQVNAISCSAHPCSYKSIFEKYLLREWTTFLNFGYDRISFIFFFETSIHRQSSVRKTSS